MVQGHSRQKELTLLENVDMLMRAEARLDNLLIEHGQNLHDLQDTFQLEKDDLAMQYQIEIEKRDLDQKALKKERNQIKQKYYHVKDYHAMSASCSTYTFAL